MAKYDKFAFFFIFLLCVLVVWVSVRHVYIKIGADGNSSGKEINELCESETLTVFVCLDVTEKKPKHLQILIFMFRDPCAGRSVGGGRPVFLTKTNIFFLWLRREISLKKCRQLT